MARITTTRVFANLQPHMHGWKFKTVDHMLLLHHTKGKGPNA
jgi:hypothetical protein